MAHVVITQPAMSQTRQLNRQHLDTRTLADALARRGDHFARQQQVEDAINLYYQSLGLRSNNPTLLRKIGDLYQQCGDNEDARLCYLGVIPESANQRYYAAEGLVNRIIPTTASHATETTFVSAPEQIPLQPPVAHGRPGNYNQFNRRNTESLGCHVTSIANGEIWFDGLNLLVSDSRRCILREHIKGNAHPAWRAASIREPGHVAGRACFLDARSSSIYYHWMLDVLPKVHLVREAGIDLDSIDAFFVRATSGFQLDTLIALGIPAEKIVYQTGGAHFQADELIVPYLKNDLGERIYTGLGLGLASWVPGFLQSVFVTAARDVRQRRLYVSRANADSRRISNESELQHLLDEFGFETIQFEGMSVEQQADAMASAECVIASHGAGLANLAFCQPGTRVLEIFGHYIVPCYWSLANLAGLEYHYFMAESVDDSATDDTTPPRACNVAQRRAKDLRVDPAQFRQSLSHICSTPFGSDHSTPA